MKLIFGTANKGKINQVKSFFKDRGVNLEIDSLEDIGFCQEIIEDGETFEENSMIKAKAIRKFCEEKQINEIIVTDDSGLCVDCLNGQPGVKSARYAGEHGTQEEILKKLLNNMKDVPEEKRTAKFVCVLTAILKNGESLVVRGETKGKIAKEPKQMGGLTYSPVFLPDGFGGRALCELSSEELSVTHREKAFLQLLEKLKNKC